MNLLKKLTGIFLLMAVTPFVLPAQKVGYMSSEEIRKHFVEAQQADQRVQSMVQNWKRQLQDLDQQIEDLEYELKKNRLVWSDKEKNDRQMELDLLKQQKLTFAKEKFEAGGEYDMAVKAMFGPVEEKIFAAVRDVASDEGYDMILDKSLHPIPYSNPKYDVTVKVLKKLGVDVDELEKQLEEQIEKDPRNKRKESREAPRRRSRRRRTEDRKIEQEQEQQQPDENTNEQEYDPENTGDKKPQPVPPPPIKENEENKKPERVVIPPDNY